MIFDSVKNLKKYKGLYKELDKLIDFLQNNNPTELEEGTNYIDGELLKANVMKYETKERELLKFENHKRYIDLHMVLQGTEMLITGNVEELKVIEPYKEENDSEFLSGEGQMQCVLKKGMFALCSVNEPHMPGVIVDRQESIKKIVFKIMSDR